MKAMLSSVDAVELMRLSEKAMPTMEKRRSTVADDAGQPKYCRAIRARLGKRFLLSAHHLRPTHSPVLAICGSLRYSPISSSCGESSSVAGAGAPPPKNSAVVDRTYTVGLLLLTRPNVGQCCWPGLLLFCCYC